MLYTFLMGLFALQSTALAKPDKFVLRFDQTGRLLNRLPSLKQNDGLVFQVDISSPNQANPRRYQLSYRCGPEDSPDEWLPKIVSFHSKNSKRNQYRSTLTTTIDNNCIQEGNRLEWEIFSTSSNQYVLLDKLDRTFTALTTLETISDELVKNHSLSLQSSSNSPSSGPDKPTTKDDLKDKQKALFKQAESSYIALKGIEDEIVSHKSFMPEWSTKFQRIICFEQSACGKKANLNKKIADVDTFLAQHAGQEKYRELSATHKKIKTARASNTLTNEYVDAFSQAVTVQNIPVSPVFLASTAKINDAIKELKRTLNDKKSKLETINQKSMVLRNLVRSVFYPYWKNQRTTQENAKALTIEFQATLDERDKSLRLLVKEAEELSIWEAAKRAHDTQTTQINTYNATLPADTPKQALPLFTTPRPMAKTFQATIDELNKKLEILKEKQLNLVGDKVVAPYEFLTQGELRIDSNERLLQHSPSKGALTKNPALVSPNEHVTVAVINAKDKWAIQDIRQEIKEDPSTLNTEGIISDVMLGSTSSMLKFGVDMLSVVAGTHRGGEAEGPMYDYPPPSIQLRKDTPTYRVIRFPLDRFQAGRTVQYSLYGPDEQKQQGRFDVATMRRVGFRGGMAIQSPFEQPDGFVIDPDTNRMVFQGGYPQLTYTNPTPDIAFLVGAAFYLTPSVIDNQGRFKNKRLPPHVFVGWTLSGTTWEELLDSQTHVGIGVDIIPGMALTAGGMLGPVSRVQNQANSLDWEKVDRFGISGWFVGITTDLKVADRLKQLQSKPILKLEGDHESK